VASLGDGLEAWFGSDFDTVNRVLASSDAPLAERAGVAEAVDDGVAAAPERDARAEADADAQPDAETEADAPGSHLHEDLVVAEQTALDHDAIAAGDAEEDHVDAHVGEHRVPRGLLDLGFGFGVELVEFGDAGGRLLINIMNDSRNKLT
jgi:hypothetical protein